MKPTDPPPPVESPVMAHKIVNVTHNMAGCTVNCACGWGVFATTSRWARDTHKEHVRDELAKHDAAVRAALEVKS